MEVPVLGPGFLGLWLWVTLQLLRAPLSVSVGETQQVGLLYGCRRRKQAASPLPSVSSRGRWLWVRWEPLGSADSGEASSWEAASQPLQEGGG